MCDNGLIADWRRVMAKMLKAPLPDGQMSIDLAKYVVRAIELGATDAKAIGRDQIILDERARSKCHYPTCRLYNTNINCPPYTMPVEEFEKVVDRFGYAIFFKIDVTSGGFEAFDEVNKHGVTNIVWRLESEAFYDGHHFAMGFGGTGCKGIFCPDVECSALRGEGCRFPWKARPGMHAVGFNVYGMAAEVGWPLHTVGPSTDPNAISHMSSFGIVLVT